MTTKQEDYEYFLIYSRKSWNLLAIARSAPCSPSLFLSLTRTMQPPSVSFSIKNTWYDSISHQAVVALRKVRLPARDMFYAMLRCCEVRFVRDDETQDASWMNTRRYGGCRQVEVRQNAQNALNRDPGVLGWQKTVKSMAITINYAFINLNTPIMLTMPWLMRWSRRPSLLLVLLFAVTRYCELSVRKI